MSVWHWLLQVTGTASESGHWYAFWSGFGSDLGEGTLLAAVIGMYHKHNCHSKGCWRVGKHVVDGTPWCSKHHQAARAVAAAQVSGGPGSNPGAAGLTADQPMADAPGAERVVPPPATTTGRGRR